MTANGGASVWDTSCGYILSQVMRNKWGTDKMMHTSMAFWFFYKAVILGQYVNKYLVRKHAKKFLTDGMILYSKVRQDPTSEEMDKYFDLINGDQEPPKKKIKTEDPEFDVEEINLINEACEAAEAAEAERKKQESSAKTSSTEDTAFIGPQLTPLMQIVPRHTLRNLRKEFDLFPSPPKIERVSLSLTKGNKGMKRAKTSKITLPGPSLLNLPGPEPIPSISQNPETSSHTGSIIKEAAPQQGEKKTITPRVVLVKLDDSGKRYKRIAYISNDDDSDFTTGVPRTPGRTSPDVSLASRKRMISSSPHDVPQMKIQKILSLSESSSSESGASDSETANQNAHDPNCLVIPPTVLPNPEDGQESSESSDDEVQNNLKQVGGGAASKPKKNDSTNKPFSCEKCGTRFTQKSNMKRHMRKLICSRQRVGGSILRNPNPGVIHKQQNVVEIKSAFNKYLSDLIIPNKSRLCNISDYIESLRDLIKELLDQQLDEKTCIKANFVLECEFNTILEETVSVRFKTKGWAIYSETDLDEHIDKTITKLEKEMETTVIQKSGWKLIKIKALHILSSKYQPIRGGSYLPVPLKIANRKCTINPINKDDRCLAWAVTAGYLYYDNLKKAELDPLVTNTGKAVRHTRSLNEVPYLKKHVNKFNYDKINFPASVKDLPKLMKSNPDLAISLFSLDDDDDVYPVKVYDGPPRKYHLDLLLIQCGEIQHYLFITNFNRLVNSQLSKNKSKIFACRRCLTAFRSEEKLANHVSDCMRNKSERVVMPEVINGVQPKVKFSNVQKQVPHDIYMVADFEACLSSISKCDNNPDISSTSAYQSHQAFSYGLKLISRLPRKYTRHLNFETEIYRGEDAAMVFLNRAIAIAHLVEDLAQTNVPVKYGRDGMRKHKEAQTCYLCKKGFEDAGNPKVADHHHITGEYRGAAHNECNLKCKQPMYLPVLFHNLGYDSSFLVQAIDKLGGKRIEVIATSEEKFITFSLYSSRKFRLQFIDTFRFMSASLESLAKNVPRQNFFSVNAEITDPLQQDLAVRKGVMCYDYISDISKLLLNHLPPKSDFNNKLSESEISDEDYAHAQNVWDAFHVKTLGEYSDLYLKIDVLLLADVFENFRIVCLDTYKLDPLHYLTAPGLAWDAALKHTGVELDLLTDYDMLMMIERGIRGGVCQCVKRYAEAQNKYTVPADKLLDYNLKDLRSFILYVDANNLYGKAMNAYLPTGGFKWVSWCDPSKILSLGDNDKYGYIFEVDVTYPEHLHDSYSDLPFLPENMVPPGGKYSKLMTTLYNKKKYVAHYTTLRQAMQAGLIVTAIHRTLQFEQSPWLASYINLNTEMRKNAKNDFEKDFYKLMNNSVFGKTMEQVRNRITLKLLSKKSLVRRYISSPLFKYRTLLGENLVAVHLDREKIEMNKPTYVGFSILEISKTVMWDFHYNKVRNWWPDVELLYMDTDAFMYLIHTDDVYQDISKHMEAFDTSDYPKDHFLYSEVNKKVLGLFKDETNSIPITHFVGLRAKMYSIKYGSKEIKKAKGVKKYAVEKKIRFKDYVKCLRENRKIFSKFNLIRSYKHQIYSITQNKLALSSTDDKRYILPDNINTLAHGHYSIVVD